MDQNILSYGPPGRLHPFQYKKRAETLRRNKQKCNAELRVAVHEKDADIDKVVERLKFPSRWAPIIKDLLKPDPNFTLIAENHGTSFITVKKIADTIDVKAAGKQNHRLVETGEIINAAVIKHPKSKNRVIVDFLIRNHGIHLTCTAICRRKKELRKAKLIPETPSKNKVERQPAFSITDRKVLVDHMLQMSRISPHIAARELGYDGQIVRRLAHHYWLPFGPVSKGLDIGLFTVAAKELLMKELDRSHRARRGVVQHYLDMLPKSTLLSILAKVNLFVQIEGDRRKTLAERGLKLTLENTLESYAKEYLSKLTVGEIRQMAWTSVNSRSPESPVKQSLLAQFDGFRPLDSSEVFLAAGWHHYLITGGATAGLPQRAEKVVHLELARGPYDFVQAGFVMRGVYFNRVNVRRKDLDIVSTAPSNDQLEKMAGTLRSDWLARHQEMRLAS